MVTDAARPDAVVRDRRGVGPVRSTRAGVRGVNPGPAEDRSILHLEGRATRFGVRGPRCCGSATTEVRAPHPLHAGGLDDAPLGGEDLVSLRGPGVRGAQARGHRVVAAGHGLGRAEREGGELLVGGVPLAERGEGLGGVPPVPCRVAGRAVAAERGRDDRGRGAASLAVSDRLGVAAGPQGLRVTVAEVDVRPEHVGDQGHAARVRGGRTPLEVPHGVFVDARRGVAARTAAGVAARRVVEAADQTGVRRR